MRGTRVVLALLLTTLAAGLAEETAARWQFAGYLDAGSFAQVDKTQAGTQGAAQKARLAPASARAHTSGIAVLTVLPRSGRLLTLGATDKQLVVWDIGTRKAIQRWDWSWQWDHFTQLASSPDEKLLVSCERRQLTVCSAEDGKVLWQEASQEGVPWIPVGFPATGQILVSGQGKSEVRDGRTGKWVADLRGHTPGYSVTGALSCGVLLAWSDGGGEVGFFSGITGRPLGSVTDAGSGLAFVAAGGGRDFG